MFSSTTSWIIAFTPPVSWAWPALFLIFPWILFISFSDNNGIGPHSFHVCLKKILGKYKTMRNFYVLYIKLNDKQYTYLRKLPDWNSFKQYWALCNWHGINFSLIKIFRQAVALLAGTFSEIWLHISHGLYFFPLDGLGIIIALPQVRTRFKLLSSSITCPLENSCFLLKLSISFDFADNLFLLEVYQLQVLPSLLLFRNIWHIFQEKSTGWLQLQFSDQ